MSIEFKMSRGDNGRKSRLYKRTKRASLNRIDAPHLPMKFLYRVCKKSELLYLKDFTKVTVCGLGGHYSIANNDTPRYYTDYNYYPYIVRVSDIENYKKEKFPKEKVV